MDSLNASSGPPALSPPGSSSSHSEPSLDELEFSVKPLPLLPSGPFSRQKEAPDGQLPPLQVAQGDLDGLEPVNEEDIDPASFDLVLPHDQKSFGIFKHRLEKRSELLFSNRHLQSIFDDSAQLHRFSHFLRHHRPASVPLLTYYLDALKALRAIDYSNAVLRRLSRLPDNEISQDREEAISTSNPDLQDKVNAAFEILAREDLPMYITHVWIQTVSMSIQHKIMGTASGATEGLAEVFCLTDPSRPDNPIVFMSEEFNRTTQYGVEYVIGRNCRFLQGPYSNPFSITRLREKIEAGVEHYETFLNYRRDGSPFVNLVMTAPLYDSRGKIRYFIGAQVDVSGLAMGCYDLGALKRLVDEDEQAQSDGMPIESQTKDEFTRLAEILGPRELDVIREHGGEMHRLPLHTEAGRLRAGEEIAAKSNVRPAHEDAAHSRARSRNRVVLSQSGSRVDKSLRDEASLKNPSITAPSLAASHNGRLAGVYENYILVRPYPSLRILFTSPSMRVPGILQSPLLDRIGGSEQMKDQLVEALANGQSVTAKVKWLKGGFRPAWYVNRRQKHHMHRDHPLDAHLDSVDEIETNQESEPHPSARSRWLHCTPLLGPNGRVGVWMIVIVDDVTEPGLQKSPSKRGRTSKKTIEEPRLEPSMPRKKPVPIHTDLHTQEIGKERYHGEDDANYNDGDDDDDEKILARPKIRPRRSSETLGSSGGSSLGRRSQQDNSIAKVIHSQLSPTSNRATAPKLSLRSPGVGTNFFSLEALSRASSRHRGGANGTKSPPPPLSSPQFEKPQRNGNDGSNGVHQVDGRSDSPLLWQQHMRSRSPRRDGSTQLKSNREDTVRIPSVIMETSADRGRSRSKEETSSLSSQNSAYTVRIEEAS